MMSELTFRLTYENQTSAAQKVYGAVPIAEGWTQAQIIGELTRTGIGLDYRVISACLSALVRAGLIKESPKGHFCRLPIRSAPAKPVKQPEPVKEQVMTQAAPTAPKQTPMDILTDLANRAAELGKQWNSLASDMENAALSIQEQMEADSAELKKLRQLKDLLKSLG